MADDTIKNLSPSAARLLLSLLTSQKDEAHDSIVKRAGIGSYATWQQAEQQLVDAGYVRIIDGSLFINLNKFQQVEA